jgi:diguanylate cyclase (GGDEF)-like protein
MSLRNKFVLALLFCSLSTVILVGSTAYLRLMHKFDALVLEDASRNFRGDVAAYIKTYGSWEKARASEPFRNFSMRRGHAMGLPVNGPGLGGGGEPPRERPQIAQLEPLPAMPGAEAGLPPPPRGNLVRAPFRFLLIDTDGRVMMRSGAWEVGQQVGEDVRERAIPVEVDGRTVAYASPDGQVNYSDLDLGYIAAIREALIYGLGAASVLALLLGLVFANGLSRSLQTLTQAIRGMERGALKQRVETASRDEVGELAAAFNRMSEEIVQSHAALAASNAQIRAQAEQLRELATRDALTGLFNRRYFDEHADNMFNLALRHGQHFAVMIGDIDYFKRINDNHSHAMGDAVLRQVAELLQASVRHTDLLARYGGEEFVIAFPQTSAVQAQALCEKLRTVIESHPWYDMHPALRVTMSMGISANLGRGSVEDMLREADEQLYRAKNAGRNQVCVPA